MAIDLTPEIIAALNDEPANVMQLDNGKNLLKAKDQGGDVPTLVEFT